jgi:hypothetical protein
MRAQLKIELPYTDPPVWRTVVVPHDIRLDRLHSVIQQSLAWDDAHMHSFERNGVIYETPVPADMDMFGGLSSRPVHDERKVTLDQVLTKTRQKLDYTYDFGDDWLHKITLEKLLPDELALSPKGKPKRIALCVDGANAAPPEDCGGLPGFENLKEALADPKHPDHDDMVEWWGDEFDAAKCSLAAINEDLKRIKV